MEKNIEVKNRYSYEATDLIGKIKKEKGSQLSRIQQNIVKKLGYSTEVIKGDFNGYGYERIGMKVVFTDDHTVEYLIKLLKKYIKQSVDIKIKAKPTNNNKKEVEQVKILNVIEEYSDSICTKYATNIENLFVYKVQNGWGLLHSIKKDFKSENKIVLGYNDRMDAQYNVIVYYYITKGLISKHNIKIEKHFTNKVSFLSTTYFKINI